MKKPTLCSCFTWIVFIELNFTVAFLLIRKTWDGRFVGRVGGWGMILKWGVIPFYGLYDEIFTNVLNTSPSGQNLCKRSVCQ